MLSEKDNQKKELNEFKNEILKIIRGLESNLIEKINNYNSDFSENINTFKEKISNLQQDNAYVKNFFYEQKLKLEKIDEYEKFKKKVDNTMVSQDIKLNGLLNEFGKIKNKYDKFIMKNFTVPGFIGISCQFSNISEYLAHNIKEMSKFKNENEQFKLQINDIKIKVDTNYKNLISLIDSGVNRCNNYTNNKEENFKVFIDGKIEEMNSKVMEMKMKNIQMKFNAEKNEDNLKKYFEEIKEMKENLEKEIEEFKNHKEKVKFRNKKKENTIISHNTTIENLFKDENSHLNSKNNQNKIFIRRQKKFKSVVIKKNKKEKIEKEDKEDKEINSDKNLKFIKDEEKSNSKEKNNNNEKKEKNDKNKNKNIEINKEIKDKPKKEKNKEFVKFRMDEIKKINNNSNNIDIEIKEIKQKIKDINSKIKYLINIINSTYQNKSRNIIKMKNQNSNTEPNDIKTKSKILQSNLDYENKNLSDNDELDKNIIFNKNLFKNTKNKTIEIDNNINVKYIEDYCQHKNLNKTNYILNFKNQINEKFFDIINNKSLDNNKYLKDYLLMKNNKNKFFLNENEISRIRPENHSGLLNKKIMEAINILKENNFFKNKFKSNKTIKDNKSLSTKDIKNNLSLNNNFPNFIYNSNNDSDNGQCYSKKKNINKKNINNNMKQIDDDPKIIYKIISLDINNNKKQLNNFRSKSQILKYNKNSKKTDNQYLSPVVDKLYKDYYIKNNKEENISNNNLVPKKIASVFGRTAYFPINDGKN